MEEKIKELEGIQSDLEKNDNGPSITIESFVSKLDLAKQFLKIQPIYYDENKNWWAWDNKKLIWRVIDDTGILNWISKTSRADTIKSSEKNEILEALRQAGRLNKPLDPPSTWIQLGNKIIDIKTLKVRDPSSEYFMTNVIPWNMGTKKDTPVIDKLFNDWVGKKKTLLYEILAYCMLRDYPIHRILCFIGAGSNGKSTYLELINRFIGKENLCSSDLDTLLNSRFEKARLYKKLVCLMGETNFNEITKTDVLKRLTGQDMIGLEMKNKNPFEDINYAKIIISTNNLPTTNDKSDGFYRRWNIVDFPNKFDKEEDVLGKIPEEEYNNLGTKLVFILRDLIKRGKFEGEGTIEQRREQFEDKSNPFDKFWKDNIVEGYDNNIWKHEFKKRLDDWCKENSFRQLTDTFVSKKMKERHVEVRQLSAEFYTKEGEKPRWRAWIGLKWK